MATPNQHRPHVIIVGGGFGGLEAARALAKSEVDITLIDRRNHHLFQPLLYQVATAALSPAEIAAPIRSVLHSQANVNVVMGEVVSVEPQRRRVRLIDGWIEYDWLVLAAGATHSYFGNPQWEAFAPGLKTLEDATEMRRRILMAFENAEYEGSADARRARLTFAIVGGGPTGVELAGAIKEIAVNTIPDDFRNIDTRTARVILLEGGNRLLASFPAELSQRALHDLEDLGVEVRLNSMVEDINAEGLTVGDEYLPVRTIFWAAGVQANPIGESLGVPRDQQGRVQVNPDLSIPGHPNVFVVGDMAAAKSAETDKPVPGVAQGALQSGKHVGKIIATEVRSGASSRQAFRYNDKGNMATIGKARAVADVKGFHFAGLPAWLLWSVVHIVFLVEFRNRVSVIFNWVWNWFFSKRGARLITGAAELQLDTLLPGRPAGLDRPTTAPPVEMATRV